MAFLQVDQIVSQEMIKEVLCSFLVTSVNFRAEGGFERVTGCFYSIMVNFKVGVIRFNRSSLRKIKRNGRSVKPVFSKN